MSALAILEEADRILADESRWTRQVGARAADNSMTVPEDANACKWCLFGAILRACVNLRMLDVRERSLARQTVSRIAGRRDSLYNDDPETTFADIKRVLRRGIDSLKVVE